MGKATKKNKPSAGKKKRDLNAELLQALDEMKRSKWARKTEFFPQPDGSIRRVITRRDGTVEKDHIIPAEKSLVAAARAATRLSQAAFAKLLGVSVRTLQEWEQGRRKPDATTRAYLAVIARNRKAVLDALRA